MTLTEDILSPAQAGAVIKRLFSEPIETLEAFHDVIEKALPCGTAADLAKQVMVGQALSSESAKGLIDLALTLKALRPTRDVDAGEFVKSLGIVFRKQITDGWDDESWNKLSKLLAALVESKGALEYMAKARALFTDVPSLYVGGKVLTDARYIYSADADTILGAVLVHTLDIEVHEEDGHKRLFISLDSDDLQKLIGALKRAQQKAEVVSTHLKKSGIPNLSPH